MTTTPNKPFDKLFNDCQKGVEDLIENPVKQVSIISELRKESL